MPKLFDASSFTNIVVRSGEEALILLKGNYVLDLTFYEVGNALWRIHALQGKLSSNEVKILIDITAGLMNWVNTIPISDLNLAEIMERAANEPTAFYDAAYVVAAELKELTLVTDDARLAKIASKHVEVKTSKDLRVT